MAHRSTRPTMTMPARLRVLAALWLAFRIVSGAAPDLQARRQPPPAPAPASHFGLESLAARAALAVHRPHASREQLAESAALSGQEPHAGPALAKQAALAGEEPLARRDSQDARRFEFHEAHMGTDTRLVVYADDERVASAAARAAFNRVEALNAILSDYQPTSELMRLSAQAGQGPVAISDDLFRVLAAAQDLAARSAGAFDVTCGPLTRLWRRARHVSELPAAARVDEARALTGYQSLQLDAAAHTATLAKAGMSLDVGGIAKGYAAEEALHVLAARGLSRALVALGGDIAIGDPPPHRDGWLIDVATLDGSATGTAAAAAALAAAPAAPEATVKATASATATPTAAAASAAASAAPSTAAVGPILLRNAAVSTAGDAEQWLTANGVRYSHILDPRTGWPMTIRSTTTVIAPHGLDADGLDTTAAILGADRGPALVEAVPGAAVFMMRHEADGRTVIRTSSRWPPRADIGHTAAARPNADHVIITSNTASKSH